MSDSFDLDLAESPHSQSKRVKGDPHEFESSDEEEEAGETEPIRVDFIDLGAAKLGATELPGGKPHDVRRSIVKDITTLKQIGLRHVFVLNTDSELKRVKVLRLFMTYTEMGFEVHRYPIIDGTPPSNEQIESMLPEMHALIEAGQDCVVHCLGGLGRTGVVLAAYLLRYQPDAWTAETVIQRIRELRGKHAIQTVKQYNFLWGFK